LRERLYLAFQKLEENPFRPRSGCDIRLLEGEPSIRALRVGAYRAIYEIVGDEVQITKIAHRKNVYER